jgi:hypothetical protein
MIVDFLLLSFKAPHCFQSLSRLYPAAAMLKQETQSWQAQPGTAWPCGPSVGTLAGAASST